MKPEINCPLCGSTKARLRYRLAKEHIVHRCADCTVEFLSPQLSEAELGQLYSESYYSAWGIRGDTENESTREMKKATFRLRLDTIRRFAAPPANILDVGCATGYFLEVAEKDGYVPFGVELSEYAAAISKKKFGDSSIFQGTLEESYFSTHTFRVIAMSDLIEHVHAPAATLKRAKSLLEDGGVVMIMTPDTGTISNRLMGRRWSHYKLEHFFYFNRRSIGRLAEQCGMRVVHYERSKKALNIDYLYTQFNVYRHWLFTPLVRILHTLLPAKMTARNFYFSIGEMVVVLK